MKIRFKKSFPISISIQSCFFEKTLQFSQVYETLCDKDMSAIKELVGSENFSLRNMITKLNQPDLIWNVFMARLEYNSKDLLEVTKMLGEMLLEEYENISADMTTHAWRYFATHPEQLSSAAQKSQIVLEVNKLMVNFRAIAARDTFLRLLEGGNMEYTLQMLLSEVPLFDLLDCESIRESQPLLRSIEHMLIRNEKVTSGHNILKGIFFRY